jgi:hypothetical protein
MMSEEGNDSHSCGYDGCSRFASVDPLVFVRASEELAFEWRACSNTSM